MTKAEIIGRVTMQTDYEKSSAILDKYRSMAKKPKYVEHLYRDVQSIYADESSENRKLIFIAVCYQVYQPLCFLHKKEDGKASGKLPTGVRDEMAKCLGFASSEMINHHKTQCSSWMKPEFTNGVERPFKQKVMLLVERFKPYSMNASDTQFKLSL
jgi:hypothetical protein